MGTLAGMPGPPLIVMYEMLHVPKVRRRAAPTRTSCCGGPAPEARSCSCRVAPLRDLLSSSPGRMPPLVLPVDKAVEDTPAGAQ